MALHAPSAVVSVPRRAGVERHGTLAWILAGYAALLPVQLPGPGGTRAAISDAFLLAYLVLRLPRMRRLGTASSAWVLALAGAMALGLLVALVRTGSVTSYAVVEKGAGLLVLVLTYACLADFTSSWARARWLLRAFLVGAVVNALLALAAFAFAHAGVPLLTWVNQPFPDARLAGLLDDPNAFGGLVGVALVLHVLTARSSQPLLRGAWSVAASVGLPLALLLTFSRSAWIGVAAGLAVALAVTPHAAGRALVRIAAPVVVAAPLVAALVLPDFGALVSRPDQVQARLSIAAEALTDFAGHPVLGIGLGSYAVEHGVIVHNTALWFLAELGVVGLVVLVGFVASFAARMLTLVRAGHGADRALAVGLLAAHATALGLSLGIEALYQRYWWLVLAVAGGLAAMPAVAGRPAADRAAGRAAAGAGARAAGQPRGEPSA